MAKNRVDMLLAARDQASKKFNAVSAASNKLTGSLKKLALAGAAFLGTRAIIRFSRAAIGFAATQQEIDDLIIQALKNSGEIRSAELLPALKAYSAEIQNLTRFSNEEAEATFILGLSMGVTADKIAETTKAAIGLVSLTSGKLGLADSMKGLANAAVGIFTSLERYIPELRKTKDATEKMDILNRKAAQGFLLARVSATRGAGPLIALKNALDDTAKTIASPFLPAVQRIQTRIKEFVTENDAAISKWATGIANSLGSAESHFAGFLNFMQTDFMGSMGVLKDNFLILMGAMFDTTVILATEAGKKAGNAFRSGLLGSEVSTTAQVEAFKKAGGKTFTLGQAAKTIDPAPLRPVGGSGTLSVTLATRKDFARISGPPGSTQFGELIRKEDLAKFQSFSKAGKTGPSVLAQAAAVYRDAFAQISANIPQPAESDPGRQSLRARAFELSPGIRGVRGIQAARAANKRTPGDDATLKRIDNGIQELIKINKRRDSRIPGQGLVEIVLSN